VLNQVLPAIDVDVVVSHPDGSLAHHGVTDSSGEYETEVPLGGSVHVLFTQLQNEQTRRTIQTYAFEHEAPPETRFDVYYSDWDDAPSSTYQLTINFPPKAGATSYAARVGCRQHVKYISAPSGVAPPLVGTVGLCENPNGSDAGAMLIARDAAGRPIAYTMINGQPIVQSGQGSWSLPWVVDTMDEVEVGILNLPAGSTLARANAESLHDAGASVQDPLFEPNPGPSLFTTTVRQGQVGYHFRQTTSVELYTEEGYSWVEKRRCSYPADLSPLWLDASRLARFRALMLPAPDPAPYEEDWPGELGDALGVSQVWGEGDQWVSWYALRKTPEQTSPFPELPPSLEAFQFNPSLHTMWNDTLVSVIDYDGATGFEDLVQHGPGPNDGACNLEATYHTY
jgi:hypothetical protein